MSSTKCPNCGLVNFSSSVTCKRCNTALASGDSSAVSGYKGDVDAERTPPRTLGILLAILGAVLSFAGVALLVMGAKALYFLVAGIGISASGVLIAAGKRIGIYLYFANLGMMFIWSLIETEGNAGKMISRLAMPSLIGLYLLTEKVRSRLD